MSVNQSTQRSSMAKQKDIFEYWAHPLLERGKISSIDELLFQCQKPTKERNLVCFACGNPFGKLQRAHIKAQINGGS